MRPPQREADDERFVRLPAPAAALVCSTCLVAPDPASPWIVPALFAGCGLADGLPRVSTSSSTATARTDARDPLLIRGGGPEIQNPDPSMGSMDGDFRPLTSSCERGTG